MIAVRVMQTTQHAQMISTTMRIMMITTMIVMEIKMVKSHDPAAHPVKHEILSLLMAF